MSEGALLQQKAAIRQAVLKKRKQLGSEQRRVFSDSICKKILKQTPIGECQSVAAFAPTADEVNIFPLLYLLKKSGVIVSLPRIIGKGELCFHEFLDEQTLVESTFPGFFEPPSCAPITNIQNFDFVIVPAVAIDKNLNRLGYGGGFYDRFLSKLKSVFCCAPIFGCQRALSVPTEKHDCPVNIAISE